MVFVIVSGLQSLKQSVKSDLYVPLLLKLSFQDPMVNFISEVLMGVVHST